MKKQHNKKKMSHTQSLILSHLKDILNNQPTLSLGIHLSLALDEYADIYSLSDKELLNAVQEYKTLKELDIDIQHSPEDDNRYYEFEEEDL